MTLPEIKKLRSVGEQHKRSEKRMLFAARLVEARQKKGFRTASDAARVLGIAGPTYLSHENGTRQARYEVVALYAREYGVSASWLLGEVGEGIYEPEPAFKSWTVDPVRAVTQICVRAAQKLEPADVTELFARLALLLEILKKAA